MKKSLFALMAAAAFSAQSVEINPDGTGQVLLYPFYTVKSGFDTSINITNTTNTTKAVKVRFSEGKNTWEVLDFNLYLSPYDVWTAVLTKNQAGGVRLVTRDTSCTVPAIPAEGILFRNALYAGNDAEGNGEAEADQSLTRLEEGHLEVIEMGLVQNSASHPLATAIKHVNGVPNDCNAVTAAWDGGLWSADRNANMSAPTGGLYGSTQFINIPQGISTTVDATAIDNFWELSGNGNSANNRPGTSFPDLNGQVEEGLSLLKLGNKSSSVVANGGLVTSTWNETIDAVSAVLMARSISNDYYVNAGLNGATDWVISFPTKHFYVNGGESFNGLGPNRPPFKSSFDADNDEGACETVSLSYFDREEERNQVNTEVDFSPSVNPDTGPAICWETSRITFNNRSVFGASATLNNIEIPFSEGWAEIGFNGRLVSNESHRYIGLPVIGFSAVSLQNGQLNGGSTLANYATSTPHKRTRQIN
ncbi:hypothetical protein [Ostreibacterium oceani]|uniref:Uncharacterized protein n=1 Tax=Ostreibacterium oceani TaxID=2654998 RepID=A0A6N7EUC4_9GAMM|nr:hypothetical protein [Ostreibacterium oceani]MPV85225.1 hypothetical protein [Ostreibacterium oceani]